jgi:serine/threonine-protein kinase
LELIGRKFGHIHVTDVVGEGGMGAVYAGYDEKLERKVALKVLHADQRLDDEARERLLREARALSKLEHRNICRIHDYIETGEVDLLVLEYIDGRTLQQAISAGNMPRNEKLRIAIAIAEVLVTAHRAGILHRDLKPDNIMLTAAGEVKVLDFGLARWLTRARSRSSGKVPAIQLPFRATDHGESTLMMAAPEGPQLVSGRPDYLATAAGITLGTPLYMSPEQARGEALTPASDMFSFGLVLQVLFSGIEPHPPDLGAREVILRAARGTIVPVQGVAGDVTALINRLEQFAPADRPTAIETVERLRWLHDKPQRIARRSAAAAALLLAMFGGWRYTVDLRRERAIAVAARADAEHRRAQAEDLINFMVGDLRKKLEPVGRLDILDDVGERALAYVTSLNMNVVSAEELVRNAKALDQIAEVRIAQGNLRQALDLANRALAFTSVAMRRDPADPEVQLAYGTSHFWVGNAYRLLGDNARALVHMRQYEEAAEQLAQNFPLNDTYQLERAYGHSVVGTILEAQGDLQHALEEFQMTRVVKAARLAASPADAERQSDLAVTDNKIGFVLYRLGRLVEAREYLARELATWQRLAARDPQNKMWQEGLTRSHGFYAGALEVLGDVDGALEHEREEVARTTTLHDFDPSNTQWTRNLAMAHWHTASLLTMQHRAGEALAHAVTGQKLMQELLAKDPQRKAWHRELAILYLTQARAQLVTGHTDAAAAAVNAARAQIGAYTDVVMIRTRAEIDVVHGDVLRARGDAAGARAHWSAALDGLRTLPAASNDLNAQSLLVRTLVRLGRAAEAAPLMARLDRAGYRYPDYVSERQEVRVPQHS